MFKRCVIVALLVWMLGSSAFPADELAENFFAPPQESRPFLFWDWIHDLVTQEGISHDLKAFDEGGCGGALIMLVGAVDADFNPASNMENPLAFYSDRWFAAWGHAAQEADRLGLRLITQSGTGWCHSGGPWVTDKDATQHLAFSEVMLHGPVPGAQLIVPDPENASDALGNHALPASPQGRFVLAAPPFTTRDVAIVAFPGEKRQQVQKHEVVELTARVERGTLQWDVPPGDWVVRRIVMKNAHSYTRVPPRGGAGFECDKLSKDAVRANFDGMVGRLIADNPELAGRSIWGVESDSWEVGHPEWSSCFREEFRKRRGYDPVPWAISLKDGPVVENEEMTARFRSDWEQTKVDLFADHYFSNMRQIASDHRMHFLTEAYYGPFDPVTCAGRADIPMGEYWASGDCLNSVRWAASSSHVYGRTLTASESYTGRPSDGLWAIDPYALKRVGDLAFCYGVNLNIIHGMAHQPWDEKWKPGMPMGFWGSMVGPRQTWWRPGRAWMDYLARCQYMLRQGRAVADVLYVFPSMDWVEMAPSGLHKKHNFDLCSEEQLLQALEWKDGRFVLPSGMEYRVLVMPPFRGSAKRQVLRKLIDLVKAGGTVVVQDRPERSPGLQDYPNADTEVRQLADELWGANDAQQVSEYQLGNGRLVSMKTWSETMDPETKYILEVRKADSPFYNRPAHTVVWSDSFLALLKGMGVVPDVEVRDIAGRPVQGVAMAVGGQEPVACGMRQGEDVFAWTHRRHGDSEIYFVTSQVAEPAAAELAFRVQGKQPEIWDPVSGNVELAGVWREEDGRTIVPLCFGEFDSKFIVFRKPGSPSGKWRMHQRDLFAQAAKTRVPEPLTIEGPWTVTFPEGWGAPQRIAMPLRSWTEHAEEGVRFFSGTATYTKTIQVPEAFCGEGSSLWLDLGQVKNLAEVSVNGRSVGVLWKPPFRIEVTDRLKPGDNLLSIQVTNTWINRMVGDEHYPDDCEWNPPQEHLGFPVGQSIREIPKWIWSGEERPEPRRKTFTTWKFYTQSTPLPASGLLGPVRLVPLSKDTTIP